MKLERLQVLESLLLGLMVLIVLSLRAWLLIFPQ